MLTFDNAVLTLYGDAVAALRWYQNLSHHERQAYIDQIGIYRAEIIRDFTIDTLWYITEIDENGFDVDTLIDLWQRIRRKLGGKHVINESI